MLLNGQVVETFLDEETDYAVGVKDEVGAICVLVADDAVERFLSAFVQVVRSSSAHW